MKKIPKWARVFLVINFFIGWIYIPLGLWLIAYGFASDSFIIIFWFFCFVPFFLGSIIVGSWMERNVL